MPYQSFKATHIDGPLDRRNGEQHQGIEPLHVPVSLSLRRLAAWFARNRVRTNVLTFRRRPEHK